MSEYSGICQGGPWDGKMYSGHFKREQLANTVFVKDGEDMSNVAPPRVLGEYVHQENGLFIWEPAA